MNFYVSKTDSDSTFIRIVDVDKEIKVEVFDDIVCFHVYKNGEKVETKYLNINHVSIADTKT